MSKRKARAAESIIKEETAPVPEICQKCGYYKPMFFTVVGKECAAFGRIPKGTSDRCGAWTQRCEFNHHQSACG